MEAGVHLPQIDLMGDGLSAVRLFSVVDAARDGGFVAVSANDHFVFPVPWLDGLSSLSAVVDRSGDMALATTLALPSLRGPVPLAKTLAALDVLSGGRVIAGLGPGSSPGDYHALGIGFEQRWARFEESVVMVRALLAGNLPPNGRYHSAPEQALQPLPVQRPVPIWLGSWGSPSGLRRVARLGDGWLASAYNTTPAAFADNVSALHGELDRTRRSGDAFPHALVTMWTWITESKAEADRVVEELLAPLLRRDPTELLERVCIGSAQKCAELLSGYARAGCRRVHFWPLGDDRRQIELIATQVMPHVRA
jgi:alkanesulfonate monooxygenase SsuD/methylene tetrahydromethanopterin reductase-like flavin-dependent oxidoreductase (luciferase family)